MASTTDYRADALETNLHHDLDRVSWRAVLAGVAIGLVAQLLLNMLGVGVGAAALDIGPGADNSGTAFSVGAGLWWAVSGILAAVATGLTAGRFASTGTAGSASWHGLISWSVTTLIVAYLLSSAVGGIMGGAFKALGTVASGAGQVAASTASGVAKVTDGDAVAKQARQLIDPSGAQTVEDSIGNYLKAAVTGDSAAAAAAKSRAVEGLAQSAKISPAEALARVDSTEASARRTYEAAKTQATEAADSARAGVATASILSFVALAIGAAASWFAGAFTVRRHSRVGRVSTRSRTD